MALPVPTKSLLETIPDLATLEDTL